MIKPMSLSDLERRFERVWSLVTSIDIIKKAGTGTDPIDSPAGCNRKTRIIFSKDAEGSIIFDLNRQDVPPRPLFTFSGKALPEI